MNKIWVTLGSLILIHMGHPQLDENILYTEFENLRNADFRPTVQSDYVALYPYLKIWTNNTLPIA